MGEWFVNLVKSRKFWVAVVCVLLILSSAVLPVWGVPQETLNGMVVILISYMVALAIDAGSYASKWQSLVGSRRFWATLIGLIGLVLSSVWKIELSQDELVGYVMIIGSLIIGLAIDPRSELEKWQALLTDRKFWAAIVGMVTVVVHAFGLVMPLGLSEDELLMLCLAFGGYITSVALKGQTSSVLTLLTSSED